MVSVADFSLSDSTEAAGGRVVRGGIEREGLPRSVCRSALRLVSVGELTTTSTDRGLLMMPEFSGVNLIMESLLKWLDVETAFLPTYLVDTVQ